MWLLLLLHTLSSLLVKSKLSNKFRATSCMEGLEHVLENLIVPDCLGDWSSEETREKMARRRGEEVREVVAMVILTFLSNLAMMIPICLTGSFFQRLLICSSFSVKDSGAA